MTHEELLEILRPTGVPWTYHHWEKKQEPPYGVYLDDGDDPFFADGCNYFAFLAVRLELYYAEPSLFALLFQIMGNVHGVRNVLYGCTASRPNIAAATTTNTKEPQTATLPITAAPMANGIVKTYTTNSTPETVYNNWFKNVWMPPLPEVV